MSWLIDILRDSVVGGGSDSLISEEMENIALRFSLNSFTEFTRSSDVMVLRRTGGLIDNIELMRSTGDDVSEFCRVTWDGYIVDPAEVIIVMEDKLS